MAAVEAKDPQEAMRFGRMFAYFVVVQVIMTTAADKWGELFSSLDAVRVELVAYPANLLASFQRLRAKLTDPSLRETMVAPSYEETRAFFLPRVALVVLCVFVVFGARLGLDALKRRIPEKGLSFAAAGAASKAAASATKRSGAKSAKGD
jgi:hypothetical protein